jgi:hypothetical protein
LIRTTVKRQPFAPLDVSGFKRCGDICRTQSLASMKLQAQSTKSNAQTGAPLGATSANNGATTAGFHAYEKAMRTLATDDGRLVSAFHDAVILVGRENRLLNQPLAHRVNDRVVPVDNFGRAEYDPQSPRHLSLRLKTPIKVRPQDATRLAELSRAFGERTSCSAI